MVFQKLNEVCQGAMLIALPVLSQVKDDLRTVWKTDSR